MGLEITRARPLLRVARPAKMNALAVIAPRDRFRPAPFLAVCWLGCYVKRARFLNGAPAIPRLDQGQEPKVADD